MTKRTKALKTAHTSNSKIGMGDNYGTGIRNPVGKMRDSYGPSFNPIPKNKLKVPPKSLA